MDNLSVTTAAIIAFSEKLEDESTAFYEGLAERWPEQAELFRTFAGEGNKYKTWIVRTYRETISDALEASYSFEGLNLAEYEVATDLPAEATLADAVRVARALEERAGAFYREVAERSESLLATIPSAFRRVARKRERRLEKLAALL